MAVRISVPDGLRPVADRVAYALGATGVRTAVVPSNQPADIRIVLATCAPDLFEEPSAVPRADVSGTAVLALPEPRDGLVGTDGPIALAGVEAGGRVAVSGRLRAEMLRVHRPDLEAVHFVDAAEARAALARGDVRAWIAPVRDVRSVGLGDDIGEVFEPTAWATEPGRGALVVDARSAEPEVRRLVEAMDEPDARAATYAEHRVPVLLGVAGGAPIGVVARPHGPLLRVRALVPAADGRRLVRAEVSGPLADPESAARRTADQLRARGALLLVEAGAAT